MKSILTAALVLVIEAGFVLSIATMPSPAEVAAPQAGVVAGQAQVPPAAPASRS